VSEWADAEFSNQESQQTQEITTDDLVLMIGEAAIEKRQAWKAMQNMKQEIIALRQTLAKEQSIQASLRQQIKTSDEESKIIAELQSQNGQLENRLQQVQAENERSLTERIKNEDSLHARIVQLEEQCHQVALERDEIRKLLEQEKNNKKQPRTRGDKNG
jgi:septal ring factor EnvC (AmiA/AmiB activator)